MIEDVFREIDINGDMKISREELEKNIQETRNARDNDTPTAAHTSDMLKLAS